tara:strand:- start:8557 stop:9105 length:549 start_codon:yes stop_codon:yes gene_type:complete
MTKIIALILFIILSPLYIITGLLIFLDSGFPIIIRQKRNGMFNKPFKMYKFRTMKKDTPNLATKDLDNPMDLITRTGHFLRKFSIDETPQVFNIIKGDMNFIGPRPVILDEKTLLDLRTKEGIDKYKPGVTGYAQINGRDLIDYETKVKYEKYYFENKSIGLDIKIIFITILKIFSQKDVSH